MAAAVMVMAAVVMVTVMAGVAVTLVAMAVAAMAGTDTSAMPTDKLGTDIRAMVTLATDILDMLLGTMVVGITVIGTLAMAATGTVGGGPMALAHAGVSRPPAGSGSATETFQESRSGILADFLLLMSLLSVHVEVRDDEIIVTLPFNGYTVTYYKPAKSPQLLARRISDKNDPRTAKSEFLSRAWRGANAKARELGWIV